MKRIGLAIAIPVTIGVGYFLACPELSLRASAPDTSAMPSASLSTEKEATATGKRGKGSAVPSVVVAEAKTEDVPVSKTVVGTIEPIDTVAVRPQIDGVVIADNVTDGQMVKAGDVLFRLDDRAIRAMIDKDQAQLAKDQASLVAANLDLSSAQNLEKQRVDTNQQVYQADAAVKVLEASIAMDKAQIEADQVQLSYMTIAAPIDGRVGVVNTSLGNLVRTADTGNGLLTITRMAPLRVAFTIAESDLPALRAAVADHPTRVQIQLPGGSETIATGTLNFIDSSVDTASGTVVLKADLDNRDGALWPGQYVTAIVDLSLQKNATTVPLIAVQQGNNGSFVFLVRADKTAAMQPVTLTSSVGDTAVIASGIKPGDQVVVDGQLHLQDGATVRTSSDASSLADVEARQ
ncbi:efflux RND transporter periplasmic adaptor subunit [Phyllobacterium brassicacearum]|uniref:Efflux RND transporter periplasmic adaptor subunit n=1 Tax=Phyllobacterium brassicacearum TaxID=314235 RepID=A0A2P7BED5_9HYPH|nr:efflux RND transporter periplasmic adaptor subunit [Phyllobacterium brassicacearum]PSH64789.1 efflux RND transporter periplasmic adaptor subunit [Phyllobacterium brassicacearum]TDQ21770.1 multidrug efflux system membrane fusion protein [Phyllobacterium brassicacearum]